MSSHQTLTVQADPHPDTSYRAGVLLSVLRMQTCAAPFAMVCRRILESSDFLGGEGTPEATTGELAASVVQPLVSLHLHALAALGKRSLGSHLHLGTLSNALLMSCLYPLDPRQGLGVNAGMQHVKTHETACGGAERSNDDDSPLPAKRRRLTSTGPADTAASHAVLTALHSCTDRLQVAHPHACFTDASACLVLHVAAQSPAHQLYQLTRFCMVWPLQFALILLRAPRQALQCGLHEAAALCAQRYDGDQVRRPAADEGYP
jgi:hypothetical protein